MLFPTVFTLSTICDLKVRCILRDVFTVCLKMETLTAWSLEFLNVTYHLENVKTASLNDWLLHLGEGNSCNKAS